MAAALLLVPGGARAATYNWGVSSGDWSQAASWGATTLPGSGDVALINGGTATVSTIGPVCNTLSLGSTPGGGGTLLVQTGGSLSATNQEEFGLYGTGNLTQSGGTNAVQSALGIGIYSGSSGSYTLTAGSLSVGTAYGVDVGYQGTGTFTQSGGTSTITSALYLGHVPGGSGTYGLSSTGVLSAATEYVGDSGTGSFTQSGGSNTVNGALYLGYSSGGNGSYLLSNGQLTASGEAIAYRASTSTFTQSGGNNAVGSLYVGAGSYTLTGGTLVVAESIDGGPGTLAINGGSWSAGGGISAPLVFASGPAVNVSYSLGNSCPLSSNSTYVGQSGTASLAQSGGMQGAETIYFGYNPGATGSYSLSGGSLSIALSGCIGYSGSGSFTQSAGNNAMGGALCLGYNASGSGTYNLTGGSLSLANGGQGLCVGNSGTGTFTQSGGTSTPGPSLYLGYYPGSSGTYTLNAGSLSLFSGGQGLCVGYSGAGTFTQSGGTNTPSGGLFLGYRSESSGTYTLSAGSLSLPPGAQGLYVGYSGGGTFTQTGGTNTVAGNFYIGYSPGGSGTYSLSAPGVLSAHGENVISGSFTQSGGTNTASGGLYIGNGSGGGTYNLNGGMLIVAGLAGAGPAFNFSGGTLQAAAPFTANVSITLPTSRGNGTIDTAGFNVTLSDPLSGPGGLVKAGFGALTLGAPNTYSGNTLVTGGTLAVANQLALQLSTLDTSGADTVSFAGLASATLGGLTGPGAINLASAALSVGNNNSSTTYSGALRGPGSLAKIGSGTLTLAGNNTYSGGTSVNAGSLIVDGSLASTAVMVNGGATLGGTGSIGGSVAVAGGSSPSTWGTISLVDGAPNTLTLSDAIPTDTVLTLGGGGGGSLSALNFEVGATADRILIAAGKVVVQPGGAIINITPLAGFGPGTYDLLDFASNQASGLGYLGLATASVDGYTLSLQSTPTAEQLVVQSVPEPGTLALLGAGLACAAAVGLRRRVVRTGGKP